MPLIIRLWLILSKTFAPFIHAAAKRTHIEQGISEHRFPERLGLATSSRAQGRWVWLHAASLGEVSQTAQIIHELQDQHGVNVLVTTLTESGANWVAQSLPKVTHQYLPLDTPLAVNNFLDHWSPEIAIFVEADIWPRLVLNAVDRNIPLALLNARPSKSRDRAPKSYRYLLSRFFMITCKSKQVVDGFTKLGIAQNQLYDFGDLRASAAALKVDAMALAKLQTEFSDRPVWIAASTHTDDEAEIVKACAYVLKHQPTALLIWAPRHPYRAQNIIVAAADFKVSQRSKSQSISQDTQIYLADTLGELGTLFSCSKIVFLGGAFGTKGGHNPYEPACFGCSVLTGPHISNHKDGFAALTRVGACHTALDGDDLGAKVAALMAAGTASREGEKGRALVAAADGSVAQTVALLAARLDA